MDAIFLFGCGSNTYFINKSIACWPCYMPGYQVLHHPVGVYFAITPARCTEYTLQHLSVSLDVVPLFTASGRYVPLTATQAAWILISLASKTLISFYRRTAANSIAVFTSRKLDNYLGGGGFNKSRHSFFP